MDNIENNQSYSSFWRNKRVFDTGGADFIGSHLDAVLARSGAKVRIAGSFERGSIDNNMRVAHEIDKIKSNLLDLSNCIDVSTGMNVALDFGAKIAGGRITRCPQLTSFTPKTKK